MAAETTIECSKEELEEIARSLERFLQLNSQLPQPAKENIRDLAMRLNNIANQAAEKKSAAQEHSLRQRYLEWRKTNLTPLSSAHRGEYAAIIYDKTKNDFFALGFGSDPDQAVLQAEGKVSGADITPILEKL
jgi:hypothetical protein